MARERESGAVLVIVVCLAALAAILSFGLLNESATHLTLARRSVGLDQAFYVAEGGAERAVSYIRRGGTVPATITGTIGVGRFYTSIIASTEETATGGTHTVLGRININPDDNPDYQFLLLTAGGASFTRADLENQDLADYAGTAVLVHVKPMGNADQTTLTVDGAVYTLDHNWAYTFSGSAIRVTLTNDTRDPQGHAVGKWYIHMDGSGVTLSDDAGNAGSGRRTYYGIYSVGHVGDAKRMVILEGVHQMSWAKYALWYNSGPGQIWIGEGETFNGPVFANTYIYLQDNPVFNALVSSAKNAWGSGSVTSSVQFNAGYQLGAPAQSMASVSFTELRDGATMVITGVSAITFSGTNLLISNKDRGWTNTSVAVPSNGVIYVQQRSGGAANTKTGRVDVGGMLDGRLTVVAEEDIRITNHITYAVHPTNESDNALGLIAKRDVVVTTNVPHDVNIYAHIIAVGSATASTADGSFYVQNHNSSALGYRGFLNVYGGIVQEYRGAVGVPVSGTPGLGFKKNYIFDERFAASPPPFYPVLTNEYQWKGWRDKPL